MGKNLILAMNELLTNTLKGVKKDSGRKSFFRKAISC